MKKKRKKKKKEKKKEKKRKEKGRENIGSEDTICLYLWQKLGFWLSGNMRNHVNTEKKNSDWSNRQVRCNPYAAQWQYFET